MVNLLAVTKGVRLGLELKPEQYGSLSKIICDSMYLGFEKNRKYFESHGKKLPDDLSWRCVASASSFLDKLNSAGELGIDVFETHFDSIPKEYRDFTRVIVEQAIYERHILETTIKFTGWDKSQKKSLNILGLEQGISYSHDDLLGIIEKMESPLVPLLFDPLVYSKRFYGQPDYVLFKMKGFDKTAQIGMLCATGEITLDDGKKLVEKITSSDDIKRKSLCRYSSRDISGRKKDADDLRGLIAEYAAIPSKMSQENKDHYDRMKCLVGFMTNKLVRAYLTLFDGHDFREDLNILAGALGEVAERTYSIDLELQVVHPLKTCIKKLDERDESAALDFNIDVEIAAEDIGSRADENACIDDAFDEFMPDLIL